MSTTQTTQAAPHKPLTATTWESIGNEVKPGMGLGWPAEVDLGHQLAGLVPHLDVAQCRLLVDMTCSGLPVVLTWEIRMGWGSIERGRMTVLVEWFTAPTPGKPHLPGRLRLRYCGQGRGHETTFPRVVAVEHCEVQVTYRDDPDA